MNLEDSQRIVLQEDNQRVVPEDNQKFVLLEDNQRVQLDTQGVGEEGSLCLREDSLGRVDIAVDLMDS